MNSPQQPSHRPLVRLKTTMQLSKFGCLSSFEPYKPGTWLIWQDRHNYVHSQLSHAPCLLANDMDPDRSTLTSLYMFTVYGSS